MRHARRLWQRRGHEWHAFAALGLLYAIAAWAIALGIVEMSVAFALELRGGVVELDRRVRPRATANPVTHG